VRYNDSAAQGMQSAREINVACRKHTLYPLQHFNSDQGVLSLIEETFTTNLWL